MSRLTGIEGSRRVISPKRLRERLGRPGAIVLDARWLLDDGEAGRAAFAQGHVPGATYVHLHDDLSDPADPVAGQMRAPAELRDLFERIGVGDDTLVVVYDDDVIYTAARVVWLLAVLGHDRAAVLDGGLPAWTAAGGPVVAGPAPQRPRGAMTGAPRPHLRRERADVERALQSATPLLDCRMEETWAAAGQHIPGARRLPAPELTDAAGGLEAPARTAERARALGLDPAEEVVLYCGGGVSAARAWLALEAAGFAAAAVYDGSWAEWSADPALPKANH